MRKNAQKENNKSKAKNAILLIGDGMGVPTVSAGRILDNGEAHVSNMDSLDFSGLIKTYNVDQMTPDSAGTATAYLCGVKGRANTLGVNAAVVKRDCSNIQGNTVDSVLEKAKQSGKSVGIVTTTYMQHASPAAAYSKTAYRGWYSDKSMAEDEDLINDDCEDISMQLFKASPNIDVIFGGGKKYLEERNDGNNFTQAWIEDEQVNIVFNKDELEKIDLADGKRLIGFFSDSHLEYELDRLSKTNQPSLEKMTEVAIKKLSANPNGYYLFVEGGKIDHGHHAATPFRALHEWIAFDKAVGKAIELTNKNETLISVSADHSHVFTFGGYAPRGASLFGLGADFVDTYDNESVFVIGYGNGPGFDDYLEVNSTNKCERKKPSLMKDDYDVENGRIPDIKRTWPTAQQTDSETHAGEDVPIFASGPWAHLLTGVNEQTLVADVAEFALCIGNYANEEHCSSGEELARASIAILLSIILYFH